MHLSINVDGTESKADVERLLAAVLFFCGHTAPTITATADVDLSGVGFGLTASANVDEGTPVTPGGDTPAAAPPPSNVEVDVHGLPYDARIHSGGDPANRKNADGSWKKKRGVDEITSKRIENELRALMGTPAAPAPVAETPAPVAETPAAAPPPPPPGNAASAPPPPPPGNAASAPPPQPDASVPTTFGQFMAWVTGRSQEGKFTTDDVGAVMAGLGLVDGNGVGKVTLLVQNPGKIAEAYAQLSAIAGG